MIDNPNTLSARYERLQEENRKLRERLDRSIAILEWYLGAYTEEMRERADELAKELLDNE